jgi:threonylcarbamoyladenosine tRNA methylthiotransferase MtaB
MSSKKRIAFHTLGCKLNFSETSTISRQFGLDGFEVVDFNQKADYYVVHTCSVTAVAEKKCKSAIRLAHRRNPDAGVAVIGCAVQANPEIFSKMEGVKWTLGNQDKFRLGELVLQSQVSDNHTDAQSSTTLVSNINRTRSFVPSYSMGDRTRSFFKVQDGCDYFCTFCSIPYMRGRSRSETIAKTIEVARQIAASGLKEIILTGVNIGDFGRQNNENFFQLINQLVEVEGIERIRISSIEPELLSNEIISFVAASPKVLPHFHIPLQSGSNRILGLMKRKYLREVFADRVSHIRQLMPDACIAVDVIVGFPGESDDDFNDTYHFLNNSAVNYLHVFSYSERPGTKAIHFPDKVSESNKKLRSQKLHELSATKKRDFYASQIGKQVSVLWESENTEGYMHGFSENYIRVRTPFNEQLINQTIPCVITGILDDETCSVTFV